MKFKLELLINKPRAEVWKFFMDTKKTKLWQRSLQTIESIQGIDRQPGAVSKWSYKEKEREFALTETVLQYMEPSLFESQFENEFAINMVSNKFLEQDGSKTIWILETTFIFKTLVMKFVGPTLKKNYLRRSQREMERLKDAVEKE